MSWNEKSGTVSRSFDRWVRVESEIRAFHRHGLLWSEEAYAALWNKAEQRLNDIFDPDTHAGDEHVGFFSDSVDGMWPDRFEWMIRAATIKDAVTAFEVYLEKALQEILRRPRVWSKSGGRFRFELRVQSGQESPGWNALKDFHTLIGNDVDTGRVREIRKFRHLLTHQRGELRSEAALQYFGNVPGAEAGENEWCERSYVGGDVQLNGERVVGIMDDLAGVIRLADHRVWELSFGKKSISLADFRELLDKKCVTMIPD